MNEVSWPKELTAFIVRSIIDAIGEARFPDGSAAAVHRSKYVEKINAELRADPALVATLMAGLERWDEQNDHTRLLMTSLLKAAKTVAENRPRLFRFCIEHYAGEPHPEVQIGLIFGAFHCSELDDEQALCGVIDWVASNTEQFDQVCSGYYGPPAECVERLAPRLDPGSRYAPATPLYFFNLRGEVGLTEQVRQMIVPFLESSRPSCRKAAEIVLSAPSSPL